MSSQLIPALLAVFGGTLLAVLLLVPFVFRSYRTRGEVGFGPALVAFGFVVYGLAILTYTLLPLPQLDEAWCAAHPALRHPQLDPLRFLADIRKEQAAPGIHGLLVNPAVQQAVFNVALFVPLGAYLRHWFGRGVAATVAIGFGVSLLVEFTQLTGNWFLFPCPYRVFDVDDLIANTLGTVVGIVLAPLLGLLTRRHHRLPADAPRPVTAGRRLLGMVVDMMSVGLLGGVLVALTNAIALVFGGPETWQEPYDAPIAAVLGSWVPAVLLLAVPMLTPGAATIGQRAVRLRWTRLDASPPGARAVTALLFGSFGYFLLSGLNTFVPAAGGFAGLLLFVSPLAVFWSRGHRGLSGRVAGLLLVDSRAPDPPTAPPRERRAPAGSYRRTTPRTPSMGK
ncbi:VanZ family protein [Pseudonocardia sp. TRM90224]|uniref:VanZ family protein n=1 Tax=Pseudonocardia sp. TRM90224 TaxID=2812678 RepID=UPI001E3B49DC|nr:VanZ family protein [Pseudonocardia sp. TRM90224]